MKELKIDKKEMERMAAMDKASLVLQCLNAGILTTVLAGEYMIPIFETLGIIKKEK